MAALRFFVPMSDMSDDFGLDRYTYHAGDTTRYQTGRVRTIRPGAHETNEGFEQRMDLMARQLLALPGIASVSLELERMRGAIVQAIVSVAEHPQPAPIVPDSRPAGGRFGGPRGARGGAR